MGVFRFSSARPYKARRVLSSSIPITSQHSPNVITPDAFVTHSLAAFRSFAKSFRAHGRFLNAVAVWISIMPHRALYAPASSCAHSPSRLASATLSIVVITR